MTAAMLREAARRPSRSEVLSRYRHLREISRRYHSAVLSLVSGDAILHNARRIGLVHGKTLVLDSVDDLSFAFDLAIYTSSMGRSRAIDRYAASARLAPGSDEALVLEAMRNARFCILCAQRKHETAGLIVLDLFRRSELWLMDEGLEESMAPGAALATRLYALEDFSMTAGVLVPFDGDLLEDVLVEAPQLGRKPLLQAVEDRRFAEALYRAAFAGGVMGQVAFQDPPGANR